MRSPRRARMRMSQKVHSDIPCEAPSALRGSVQRAPQLVSRCPLRCIRSALATHSIGRQLFGELCTVTKQIRYYQRLAANHLVYQGSSEASDTKKEPDPEKVRPFPV